jgi:hypothetical protein
LVALSSLGARNGKLKGASDGARDSYSAEVDQPLRVVMSKRRRCWSEEPETMNGGLKSTDAILTNEKRFRSSRVKHSA